jgi:ArsR family transcriptional regulator
VDEEERMKKKILREEIYERQAEICAALANPVRLMILDLLAEEEATATDLLQILKIPKSNLSQHLKVLKTAGILKVRSEGLYQNLSLAIPEVKQACALVRKVLASQMSKRMNQQAGLAKALRRKF